MSEPATGPVAKPPWERRLVAGLLCATIVLGAIGAALFGISAIVEGMEYDGPELPFYIAAGILSVAVCVVGWFAAEAAGEYAAGRPVSGKRVAWLFAATWVLWFAWGIPATYSFFSAGLVVYTVLTAPVVALVLLVSWLVRRPARPRADLRSPL